MEAQAHALFRRAEGQVQDAGRRALAATSCLPGPVPSWVAEEWAYEVGAVLRYVQRLVDAAPADQRAEVITYAHGLWEITEMWRDVLDTALCAPEGPDWDAELSKIS